MTEPGLTARSPALRASWLGATLYVPAIRNDLLDVALGRRIPRLRSAVLDLEDSVREVDCPRAIENVAELLDVLRTSSGQAAPPWLFVRPRHPDMLATLMALPGIEQIAGFVLPKATADNMPDYISLLGGTNHLLMPTVETREAFDRVEMYRLREQLLAIRERILVVRIGGNDLLQILGCRRSTRRTAYDGPLGKIIGDLISIFLPWGFSMSAPVVESYDDKDLIASEIERDLEHGLLTKSAIHPAQIDMIHEAYRVSEVDLATARMIVADEAPAVFARGGVMSEPATHKAWAHSIIERAAIFGTCPGAVS